MADPSACNVADQEGDPASVLELCRRVIATRAGDDDLAVGDYRSLPSPEGTWAFRRGVATTVALNMSEAPATFGDVRGTVAVSTDPELEGSVAEGALTLGAWSGVVLRG
jgi:hypothetical protein